MNTERYQRQIVLNGFGIASQERLAQAKVLVIGAGGLGCPALQYLVAAGVGTIGISDNDIVEISNLQRQILYGSADIGLLKVEVAANRLQQLNPEVNFRLHPVSVDKKNVLEIIKDYDVIFDGTDNFESRYLINDACALQKKPLVFAAVSGFEGQLAVFNVEDENGVKTNYRDLFPVSPKPGEIPNCAENGILGVIPGIIGTMAAGEIIKLVAGIGKPLINKLLHYNLLTQEQYDFNISPSDEYHHIVSEADFKNRHNENVNQSYSEIDVQQMNNLRNHPSTVVIDVRERHEFPRLDSAVYKQVPMAELESFASTIIEQQNIILICQHGIRSVAAAEILCRKLGETKNIYSLKGGISKWRQYFLTTQHEQ